jgi:hypothetical protein
MNVLTFMLLFFVVSYFLMIIVAVIDEYDGWPNIGMALAILLMWWALS